MTSCSSNQYMVCHKRKGYKSFTFPNQKYSSVHTAVSVSHSLLFAIFFWYSIQRTLLPETSKWLIIHLLIFQKLFENAASYSFLLGICFCHHKFIPFNCGKRICMLECCVLTSCILPCFSNFHLLQVCVVFILLQILINQQITDQENCWCLCCKGRGSSEGRTRSTDTDGCETSSCSGTCGEEWAETLSTVPWQGEVSFPLVLGWALFPP